MVRRRPAGPQQHEANGRRIALARRAAKEPLSLVVKYRGGAEAWWEIKARGRTYRKPGWMSLQDVMTDILSGDGYERPS